MKLNRLIAVSVLCVLCVGSYGFATKSKEKAVNRDLQIIDVTGNRDELGKLAIESLLKVSSNKFEKVTLSKAGTYFSPTKYDEMRGADDRVLNNKDLLRGKQWAPIVEDEEKILVAQFNPEFPWQSKEPTVEVASKNKKTGKIISNTVTLKNISLNAYADYSTLLEVDHELYYTFNEAPMNGGVMILHVYKVNQENMTLEEVINHKLGENNGLNSSLITDGKYMYSTFSNGKEVSILTVDPQKKEVRTKKIDTKVSEMENFYIETLMVSDHEFLLYGNKSLYALDKNTLKLKNEQPINPSFAKKFENMGVVDHKYKDGKIHMIYTGYTAHVGGPMPAEQLYVAVYDTELGKITYEGKLPSITMGGQTSPYKITKDKL